MVIFATEEIGHIIEERGRGLTDPDRPEADSKLASIQFEVLPLGRYCADIASDSANILGLAPTTLDGMPGGDDQLDSFDAVS